MKKKYLKTCISVLAVTAVLLSACGGPQQKNVGKTTMETAKLADSIRKKYNEKYEYADPIRGVARDERLKLKMGFDIMNAGFTEYTQIVNVYKDRNSPIRSDHILSGMKKQRNYQLHLRDGV